MNPLAAFLLLASFFAAFPPAARCADEPARRVPFFSRSQGYEHSCVLGDTEADLTPNLAQTCPDANTLPVQPTPAPKPSATVPEPPNNTLTEAEKAAGYDFKARVAKSKFGKMPGFATATTGWIGLQGDHGSISFRNIKVRPLLDNK